MITEWVPFNLADSREALQKWETMEQRGQWIVGYHQGASGALLIGGEPDALVDGYRCGERAHNDSSAHRAEVSERRRESAKKRWDRDLNANANANAHANAHANASCKTHAQDRTGQDITEQDKEEPPKAPRGAVRTKFLPPTESEWVAYCFEMWPEWSPICSAESWAYYQGVGWRMRSGPIRDWKATARTAHGNARSWGKLQETANGKPAAPMTNRDGEILATGRTTAREDETLEHWRARMLKFHATNPEIVMTKITFEEKKMLGLA